MGIGFSNTCNIEGNTSPSPTASEPGKKGKGKATGYDEAMADEAQSYLDSRDE